MDAGIAESKIDVSEISSEAILGYTCDRNGNSFLKQLETLMVNHFIGVVELPQGIISFRKLKRPQVTLNIPLDALGTREEGQSLEYLISRTVEETRELPRNIIFSFIDRDKEWETGNVESDFHPLATGTHVENMSTDEILTRAEAKVIANKLLYQIWERYIKYEFTLPFEYKTMINPLDVVTIDNRFTVQIINITLTANWLLKCEAFEYQAANFVYSSSGVNAIATPVNNAPPPQPVAVSEQSIIANADVMLLDAPLAFDSDIEIGMYVFSNSTGNLLIRSDSESSYAESLEVDEIGTYGTCNTILGFQNITIQGNSYPVNTNLSLSGLPIIDNINTLTVTLSSGNISSLTQSQFDKEEVLLFIGRQVSGVWEGEYICANLAVKSGTQIKLSELKRGLRGTEYYINRHVAGESVFLIESDHPRVTLAVGVINQQVSYKLQVVDIQDPDTITAKTVNFQAQGLFSYSPSDLSFSVNNQTGELTFNVVSRSRLGQLQQGEQVKYELDVLDNSNAVVRTLTGSLKYTTAQQSADGILEPFKINAYRLNSITGRGFTGYFREIGNADTIINLRGTKNGTGDITINWDSRSVYTGQYRIEILNSSNAVVRSQVVATNSYSYLIANQTTDFGSIQSSITARVARYNSTTGNGTFSTATITPPAPNSTVTVFNPTTGEVGDIITVTGTNLSQVTKVEINDITQDNLTIIGNTSLSFAIASKTVSGRIKLTTPAGIAQSVDSIFIQDNNFIFLVNKSYVVPGDFNTISDAIAFLNYKILDNVTINLGAGTFAGNIVIEDLLTMSNGLKIQGSSINSTTINGYIDISASNAIVSISNLTIDPTSSTLNTGIRCRNKTNLTATNVRVKDFQLGISLNSTSSASINNCQVQNCSIYGIHCSSSSIASVTNTTVTACGSGFAADNCATIVANGCTSSNNTEYGFKCEINSQTYAFNTSANSTGNGISNYNVSASATPNALNGIIFFS